jgi:hypothetical protein
MKTKEEIENICGNIVDSESINDQYKQSVYEGCVLGYTQCQEDMADYIFQVAFQFHRLGKYYSNTSDTHFTDIYEETINSLNNQD